MNNEQNLENVNQIDMECNVVDDDDDMVIISKPGSKEDEDSEARPLQTKTGIIIDLSDDDDVKITKTITAEFDKNDVLQVKKNFNNDSDSEFKDYNAVDMECSSCEDDDDDFGTIVAKKTTATIDFSDDDEDVAFENKELVDEDMIPESKGTTQGRVEADYWDKLQKQHAKTNKKGAYNTFFHLAGDPKKEMDLFNHDMKPATNPGDAPTIKGSLAGQGMDLSGAPAASATGASAGFSSTGASAGGEGAAAGAACESLNENYDALLQEIFAIIGFDVVQNSDGSYVAMDLCDDNNDIKCANRAELFSQLKPYVDDCFIYPLQIHTGQKFDTCKEFCDWYTPEVEAQFPKCKSDIRYCDVLANHLDECKF